MCCCSRKLIGLLFLLAVISEVGLLVWVKTSAPAGMLGWVETRDPSQYYGPNAPDPPYELTIEDRDLLVNRVAEANALSGVMDDFGRIAALRNWTRSSCTAIKTGHGTYDPSEVVEQFESGQPVACGEPASLYCATLIAHGHRARLVQLIRDPLDVPHWREDPPDTHLTVEVYSPAHQDWMVSDPTFNCWFHLPDSDSPLSARDLQLIATDPEWFSSEVGWVSIVRTGRVIADTDGHPIEPTAENYYIDPVLLFANVFFLYHDAYGSPPEDPVQRYIRLAAAHVLGTEKVVWCLPPGQGRSYIAFMHASANWLPVGILVLLILLLVPGGKMPVDEDDNREEE